MKISLPLIFLYNRLLFVLLFFLLINSKSFSQVSAVVDYGKSYINVSKGNNGGTIEPGDTLEIRATFVVKSATAYNVSFTDAVPANTSYIPNTLRVLTNEGKIYQQFTDALDGDAGNITGTAITINLGKGATNASGGSVANTNKPSFYGGACIMVASYRIVVNAVALGTIINLGNGSLSYNQNNTTSTTTVISFPAMNAVVYKNYGMCSSAIGANAILTESGGTFGSGSLKDRGPSASVPNSYIYAVFNSTTGMPNDYYYGVSNNTSGGTTATTGYSTVNTWAYPDNSSPSHRIFSVWDIIGDHTGAANPLLGNPATDDDAGQSGGYMVVINSSYRTDTAFLDTVTNLCPNTYYQYTAWFRNICSKCGCDSNGKGATSGAGYIPTAPGDSSGVHPNLTFNVNGYDYYTTGNMLYTGQWIQKGFTYLTGPTQTSMTIYIHNNAPGGGGNDWAIDDIGVASCLPNIALTPNKPDTLCQGADDTVRFEISSYFNNYTEWQLQKSTDGGITWTSSGTDTTGAAATGSSTPVYDSSTNQYEYLVTRYYRLTSDTLTNYRITVASTTGNLSNSNCAITGTTQKLVYGVNCMIILPANIIYFKGNVENGFANLQWLTSNETGNITYSIERSDDQVNFSFIGIIPGNAGEGLGATYHFIDSKAVGAATYYRINMISNNYNKYSTVILLSNSAINFDLKGLTNPFTNWLSFDLTVPDDGTASFTLIDMYGRVVNRVQQNVTQGINNIKVYNLGNLSNGTYNFQVQYVDKTINKLVIKLP